MATKAKRKRTGPFHTRWAIKRDLPAMAALPGAWTVAEFEAALRQRDVIGIVAERGDEVEAVAVYRRHPDRLELLLLVGSAEGRGELVAKCVGKAVSHRRPALDLTLAHLAGVGGLDLSAALARHVIDQHRAFGLTGAEALAIALGLLRVADPPAVEPEWRTDTVRALAAMVEPPAAILADALQDAGCAADGLLALLRAGGTAAECLLRALRPGLVGE